MTIFSHPFKLALLLLVAISMPLLEEARPLGTHSLRITTSSCHLKLPAVKYPYVLICKTRIYVLVLLLILPSAGVACVNHDDLHASLLPLPQTSKETSNSGDDALLGDMLAAKTSVASALPSSPDDELQRLARSAPSPRPPLCRRQPTSSAGQLSASSGPGPRVGGARKPSAPPPPGGPKPPHWQSSELGGPRPRPRPLLVDVSDVLLRVLQRMVSLGQSRSRPVHISAVVRGMQLKPMSKEMQSC